MDGKAQLRRYLEQRRELGESEFVLDSVSVEDALRTLGALKNGPRRAPTASVRSGSRPASVSSAPSPSSAPKSANAPEAPVTPAIASEGPAAHVVQDASEAPRSTPEVPAVRTRPSAEESVDMPRKKIVEGLVVGSANAALFANNPFADCKSLDEIAERVQRCKRCDLYKTATHGVPGEGDPKADLMCVGEAPGANEDATGRPFVGAAGQLMDKILGAIDIQRKEVFIANVLKHRPPGNRNPRPDEVEACSPYLIRQIELVRPKVIIAWGTFAAQTLLDTKTPIGKLRGMVHRYYGVPLIVTYHPAALLRNPAWKRPTWEDVKLAKRVLDDATAA